MTKEPLRNPKNPPRKQVKPKPCGAVASLPSAPERASEALAFGVIPSLLFYCVSVIMILILSLLFYCYVASSGCILRSHGAIAF